MKITHRHFFLALCLTYGVQFKGTFIRKRKEKTVFLLLFAHLIVPLTSSKILPLDKTKNNFFTCYDYWAFKKYFLKAQTHIIKINEFIWFCSRLFDKFFTFEKINTFIFYSLNQNFRTFDFVEDTPARQMKEYSFFLFWSQNLWD